MSPSVPRTTRPLHRHLHVHRAVALAQATAALGALSVAYGRVPGPALFAVVLCTAAFAVRRLQTARRTADVLRRLRLEACVTDLDLPRPHLRFCIERTDHIWNASLLLGALRHLRWRPLPRLLSPAEREARIARAFRKALRPLVPSPVDLDPLLLVGAAGAWLLTEGAAPSPPQALAVGAVVAATLLSGLSLWRVRDGFAVLTDRLAAWAAAAAPLEPASDPAEPYAHTMLYRSRAWFGAADGYSAESSDSAASSDTSASRTVTTASA